MRRTKLSARTSVILSAGVVTLEQDAFQGIGGGAEKGSVVLNLEAAQALLPVLVKFVGGRGGYKARSRSDDALAKSPDEVRAAKSKTKPKHRNGKR